MRQAKKLIVCVCPTGSWLMKDFNPNVPIRPEEIAEEVRRSWNEGASIVHIHARDQDGNATTSADVFREIDGRIRERGCDIILQHSCSSGRGPGQVMESGLQHVPENLVFSSVNRGLEALDANPEMASLDIGISVVTAPPGERIFLWTRSFVEAAAKMMLEKGIKSEPEVYHVGGMVEVNDLIQKGLLVKPYWISFCLGMQRTVQEVTPYTPRNLMHLVDQLPPDSLFTAMGIGPDETATAVQSILLGGHVRVGFEDNPYYSRGRLATSNAELVARIVRIARDLGREIATPDEARELLGIPIVPKYK
jgi:3-keto-5-aminohexanoate cleavage enzyme